MTKKRIRPVRAARGARVRLSAAEPDPEGWLKSRLNWESVVTVVDVFSGVGGLSFGLDSSEGLQVVAAFEQDPIACETHRANMPALVVEGDVAAIPDFRSVLRSRGVRRVDILAGGPPCQGFSRLGKGALRKIALDGGSASMRDDRGSRRGQDKRNWMFRQFIRALRQLKPKVVLIENVPEMLGHLPVIAELMELLEDVGYQPYWVELLASDYGVPQRRRRLFVVGTRGGRAPVWPRPSSVRRTLKDAIGDLPAIAPGEVQEEMAWHRPDARNPYLRLMRTGLRGAEARIVTAHVTRPHRPEDVQAFGYMNEGDKYSAVPKRMRRYRDDIFTDKYHRMVWSEPAWTVTAHLAKDGYKYIHPQQNRTLSVREVARVQSFPDRFHFAGPRTSRYRHIGNAVPPLLAQALAPMLLELIA